MSAPRSPGGISGPLCPRCGKPLMHIVVLGQPSVDHCSHCGYERPSTIASDRAAKKFLQDMSPDEMIRYVADLSLRLQEKQRRERVYLERRAKRRVHTETDEAYERDQELEDALLALLVELEHIARTLLAERDGDETR